MRKYFGTDGIRNIANTNLTPELVYKVAKACVYVLYKKNGVLPTILIGKDTRISGDLIESAMTAGFLSCGANVKSLGVLPTPAIAYVTKKLGVDASVVISASHNSFEFNGIKIFSNKGMKISDELEEQIEQAMESEELNNFVAKNEKIGTLEINNEIANEYINFLKNTFYDTLQKYNKKDFRICLDTANGATYKVAEQVFKELGLNFDIINNKPNGININDNCGSTYLEGLQKAVIENKFDLGIAYDGDGDRCLAIDNKGNVLDGDKLMAIMSAYFKEQNAIKKDTIVATVMSNLGFVKYCEKNNLNLIKAKVGDRYVLEEMLKGDYNFGGEQSGHIIMLDYNSTGDGVLTSLMLILAILKSGKTASELSEVMKAYPQVLVNAKVSSDKKDTYSEDLIIKEEIEKLEKEFAENGRVLIRPSGTEPLIRVMIEGEDQKYIEQKANKIAKLIEERLG